MSAPFRAQLARHTGIASRERVYETADGLEVESLDHYELARRRVFFDDILLVTYHRQIGALFIFINAMVVCFFGGMSAIMVAAVGAKTDVWPAVLVWMAFAVPSFIAIVIRLALRVDVINVYGRRSKATLRFSFRKTRAREVYGRICARARQAQRITEPEPPPAPAPESPAPPPPPEPALP